MNTGISLNQDTLGCEPLCAVAGDGITMIEMSMPKRIELELTVIVEANCNSTVMRDGSRRPRTRFATVES